MGMPAKDVAAAHAQDSEALVSFKSMKPGSAVTLAQAALTQRNSGGYQVAVAVVDRFGQVQAVIRDRFAGVHRVDTATAKAWTAASFRTAAQELDEGVTTGTLSRDTRRSGALVLGGGMDEDCARAGIEAPADRLEI